MDDIQHLQKQQPESSPRNEQSSGGESADPPPAAGRRKLAIVVILLMMVAVFVDSGFFAAGTPDPSAALEEINSLDAFLAEMPDAGDPSRAADSAATHDDTTVGRRDSSLHVTATTLSRPETGDTPFSLTIPASSPAVGGDSTQRGHAPFAEPAIRLSGSIQPLP